MTTIAIRNGVMAADSQVSCGNRIEGLCDKIVRLKDGSVLGMSGDVSLLQVLCDWVNGSEKPTLKEADKFAAMILTPNGVVKHFDENFRFCTFKAEYYAIGSGLEFALGAMAHGATAQEAVECAIKHDKGSCGPVFSMRPDNA